MPQNRISHEDFLSLVEAGVQAPSADNNHFLHFHETPDGLIVQSDVALSSLPFHRRILGLVSIGAVVENIVVRARAFGLAAEICWFPNGPDDVLATQLMFTSAASQSNELVDAIASRHTSRGFFHPPGLSAAQKATLQHDAESNPDVSLVWLDAPDLRHQALRLIRIAEAERFRAQPLHEELFAAIRFDVGWKQSCDHGLAPASLAVEWPLRPAFQTLRYWSVMRVLARLGLHHLLGMRAGDMPCRLSPHVAVIARRATTDPAKAAIAAGQALERVWLRITGWKFALQPLAASALFAMDGYEDVRSALREELKRGWAKVIPGLQPLIVIRIGTSPPSPIHSGRKPISSYVR